MQCRSVYQFIMSFIKVLICSECAIEALKVTMSVCLSIARFIHNLRIFWCCCNQRHWWCWCCLCNMQCSINCNKKYEDVYECCQLKYMHTKAAASLKQFCTLLGVCYHDKPINPIKKLFMVEIWNTIHYEYSLVFSLGLVLWDWIFSVLISVSDMRKANCLPHCKFGFLEDFRTNT